MYDGTLEENGGEMTDFLSPEAITKRVYDKYRYTHWENGWLYGVWYCGTSFQKAIYYGQFPSTFVKRVTTAFPPASVRFLHLCCGRCHIDGAVNVDMMPLPEVDIVGNAEGPLPLGDKTFDVVLIDPPYSEEDSKKYGVPRLVKAGKVMKEAGRLLDDGGWLLWLDEKYPSYRRKEWALTGLIGIVTGFERRSRILSMFRRR